jgi:CRISPR/Cas system CMR subunit Cmr4 (Cas7 group RAMP superfamily)
MTSCWLICREPVHIGGADSSSRGNNNPVYRLPDRTPAIPGSSLRGALREGAEHNPSLSGHVTNWFGGKGKDESKQEEESNNNMSPGNVALGWGWPVWWPVHVLGYGNWWVSCPSWIKRFQQLSHQEVTVFDKKQVYVTDSTLAGKDKNIYLRWLKLSNPVHHAPESLPLPDESEVPKDRCIILPDESINVIVDMGMVHQPRVSLRDKPDEKGSLVDNLFAVEGFPPGAVFMVNCAYRKEVESAEKKRWENFLVGEHFLGGLWGAGYGKIAIALISKKKETP